MASHAQRTELIVGSLTDAFGPLMKADPDGFRTKFRKMARDPFAFYRGSACVFYADVTQQKDRWSDARTDRVWIHGDLHAENFGTYMNSHGELVFDVNDFDEAYLGHFGWDLRRFSASLALMCWQKALPEDAIAGLAETYLRCYVEQVHAYLETSDDLDFALRLDNTDGVIHGALATARLSSRRQLLDSMTEMRRGDRRFVEGGGARRLPREERRAVERAYKAYLDTIPEAKKQHRDVFYDVKDVVGKSGFGIGSAGLPAYNVLIEGFDQALENDIVLSMKQANVPAVSRFTDDEAPASYFRHEGERTVVSQRALQAHTDPFLGHTEIDGVGYVVAEVSPYEFDLAWDDLTEPHQIEPLMGPLGRATAKIHCASDADSDQTLVPFQTEEAIARVLDGKVDRFIEETVAWGLKYAGQVRTDHALFVDAFRGGEFGHVQATGS